MKTKISLLIFFLLIGLSLGLYATAQKEIKPLEEQEEYVPPTKKEIKPLEKKRPNPLINDALMADEDISYKELEIKEPKVLPDNMLYPVKEIVRDIKEALTLNPVKRVNLELQHANEKLIETKEMVEKNQEKIDQIKKEEKEIKENLKIAKEDLVKAEQGDDQKKQTEIQKHIDKTEKEKEKIERTIIKTEKNIEKALDNYVGDIEKIEKQKEKLKEKIDDPEVEKFLNKFTDNEIKHQKLLDKIEKEIPAEGMFEKIEEVKEKSIEKLGTTLIHLKDPNEIKDTLVKITENQKGSEFKDFKNLEVLKELEEKIPTASKEAVEQAQEITLERMEQKISSMPEKEQEKFKEYVKYIGGNEIRHLEIINSFENQELSESTRRIVEETKEVVIEKIEEKMKKLEPQEKDVFLKSLKDGEIKDLRIIKELENNLSTDVTNEIIDVKKETMENLKKKFEATTKEGMADALFKEVERFQDVKQIEVIKEIEKIMPGEKKELIKQMEEKIVTKIEEDIAKAKNTEERTVKIKKIAGDQPEHIAIVKEIEEPNPLKPLPKEEIIKEQAEKLSRRIEIIEDPQRLKLLENKIQENEEIRKELEIQIPGIAKKIEGNKEMLQERVEKLEEDKVGAREIKKGACITLWAPVCGKDGKTYSNACFAKLAGIEIAYDGECEPTEEVYFESFELGFGGWTPDHYLQCEFSKPPCWPLEWSIVRSTEQAYDGIYSLRGYLNGDHDDGTIWVERAFEVTANTNVTVEISFYLWSEAFSEVNRWPVVAYIGVKDPEEEKDFDIIGETNEVAGWKKYSRTRTIKTDSSGILWVGFGFGATWETEKTHYMDLVRIELEKSQIPSEKQKAALEVVVDEKIIAEDLGVKDPKILPDNPAYAVKEIFREVKQVLTFDPIKKADLKLQSANEKIIEVQKMVEKHEEKLEQAEEKIEKIKINLEATRTDLEKTEKESQKTEIQKYIDKTEKEKEEIEKVIKKMEDKIEKTLDSYAKDIETIEKRTEKVKEKIQDDPKLERFVDKFIDNGIKHQKLMDGLEKQVADRPETLNKFREIKEQTIEHFSKIITKIEYPEALAERLNKNLEKMEGGKYKNFKNLEVLLRLEEKVPEQAKEAIRQAQENTLKRLHGNLEQMSPEDQEKFREYLDNVEGDQNLHLEILERLEEEKTPATLKAEIEENKEMLQERVKKLKEDEERSIMFPLGPPAPSAPPPSLAPPSF